MDLRIGTKTKRFKLAAVAGKKNKQLNGYAHVYIAEDGETWHMLSETRRPVNEIVTLEILEPFTAGRVVQAWMDLGFSVPERRIGPGQKSAKAVWEGRTTKPILQTPAIPPSKRKLPPGLSRQGGRIVKRPI